MKTDGLFWSLAIAAVLVSGYAITTMSESAFYAAAGLAGAALVIFMFEEPTDD